jgi:5-methyltetrahydropteroyltriglutamate--homocysteine methyltransferase
VAKTGTNKYVELFKEAKEAGFETRPVLTGPITYLLIGKPSTDGSSTDANFKPISLLEKLVPVYVELLKTLKEAGATSVQLDEPALVMDSTSGLASEYEKTYGQLAQVGLDITVATYFGRLDSNIDFIKNLPIQFLHIDLTRAPEQLDTAIEAVKSTKVGLSLGVVSGRNIWKNDFEKSIAFAKKAIDALGADRVVVATSSSLLHTPVTLANESKLKPEEKDWFSFATEKCSEVAAIAKAASGQADAVKEALEANKKSIKARRDFESQSDDAVRQRVAGITDAMLKRKSEFPARREAQAKVHPLPKFYTTTIGSYPVRPHSAAPAYRSPLACSKPRRSARLAPSSLRASSPPRSTTTSSPRRSRWSSTSRRRLASTSSSTASPSATTWSSTLASA